MALLGTAAMAMFFDVAPEAVAEHDDWHTHEHMPERLSIPGFLRGSRWTAVSAEQRYFVLYEVAEVAVLSSAAYLERLNHPTPWTAKMMPSYRDMRRGFCRVERSFGLGLGGDALSVRLSPQPGKETSLRAWLTEQVMPGLPSRPGLAGAHLLQAAAAPSMTREQEIRGKDAGVDWLLLVTGYSSDALKSLRDGELRSEHLKRHGAAQDPAAGIYRLGYFLPHSPY
jgi:hypothetical protein